MRALRISVLVGFAAWVIAAGLAATPAAAMVSTYRGTFLCDDRGHIDPLGGMNVELWERGSPDFLPVEIVGHRVDQGFTDASGNFSLTTEDNNDNYFVRMALRDAHGVHLRDFWGINDWSVDSEQKRNDVAVRDYGNIVFSTPGQSHKCAIWNGVHKANERFRAEIGTDPPSHGVELEADAVTAGVPFTPGTSILWPGGFEVGYGGGGDDSITRHEYGHVIRHGYDGDFGHFLGDVVTYNYLQNHETCNHTNGGFAFNEGWAEFWAEDFSPAPDCGRPGDMETEGDVAAALQELMENCAGGQRKVMVEVLQRNPGTIHSFDQFKSALGCPIPRLIPVTVVRAELAPPPPPPVISAADRAEIAKREVGAGSKLIGSLGKRLDLAERRAGNAPTCDKAPCKAGLKAATMPAVLRFEIDLAKVQRAAAAATDTVKEQSRVAAGGAAGIVKFDAGQEKKTRTKAARTALADVGAILAAARPILKLDRSGFAKRVRRALLQAEARFRKATGKGAKALPGSLTLPPLDERFPKPSPRALPTPLPFPTRTAGTRTVTTLTFDECPKLVVNPKPIEVAGKISPVLAGAQVSVTFVSPTGRSSAVDATVGADGSWSAALMPAEPSNTGTWTVNAAFAGDSTHAASSAPTCSIEYQ